MKLSYLVCFVWSGWKNSFWQTCWRVSQGSEISTLMNRYSALSAHPFNFLANVKAKSSCFPLDESSRTYSSIWSRISGGISVIGWLPLPGGDRMMGLFIGSDDYGTWFVRGSRDGWMRSFVPFATGATRTRDIYHKELIMWLCVAAVDSTTLDVPQELAFQECWSLF